MGCHFSHFHGKTKTSERMVKNQKCLQEKLMMKFDSILDPISVDENGNYDLPNGLVDVNRDIMVKLLVIIVAADICKIRNIIGIGKVFYMWSKQRAFRFVQNAYSGL